MYSDYMLIGRTITEDNAAPFRIASLAAAHIKDGTIFKSREAVGYAVTFMMLHERAGTAYMLLFDKSHRIIKIVRLKSGHGKAKTDITAAIDREVSNTAASYFVLVHNHKNSPLVPSNEDMLLTEKLYEKYSGGKIKFSEHYIVSGLSDITLVDGKRQKSYM